MGSVVVIRSYVGAQIAVDEIESEVGIPLLAVMPPDADLCAVAESLRKLSFALQPDGLSAASYFQVA
jgi:hypothetical protein